MTPSPFWSGTARITGCLCGGHLALALLAGEGALHSALPVVLLLCLILLVFASLGVLRQLTLAKIVAVALLSAFLSTLVAVAAGVFLQEGLARNILYPSAHFRQDVYFLFMPAFFFILSVFSLLSAVRVAFRRDRDAAQASAEGASNASKIPLARRACISLARRIPALAGSLLSFVLSAFLVLVFMPCLFSPTKEDTSRLRLTRERFPDVEIALGCDEYLEVTWKTPGQAPPDQTVAAIYESFFHVTGEREKRETDFLFLNIYDSDGRFLYQVQTVNPDGTFTKGGTPHY